MHRLLKLLDANRGRGISARLLQGFRAADPDKDGDSDAPGAPDTDEATLYVYDVIGDWGDNATDLVRAVAAIKASTIHLRINSPGGDVFEARAMKAALEQHPAKVIAHVDGLAASAASFLMLAADEIEIADGAFVMIHNPWGFAMGDAHEMRQTADLLDQIAAVIARDYSGKTGLPEAELRSLMNDETWMDSAEALAKGFVDRIASKSPRPSNAARFDLSAYAHAPKALTEQPSPAIDAALGERRAAQDRLLRLFERT